jgi:hypothetical protein
MSVLSVVAFLVILGVGFIAYTVYENAVIVVGVKIGDSWILKYNLGGLTWLENSEVVAIDGYKVTIKKTDNKNGAWGNEKQESIDLANKEITLFLIQGNSKIGDYIGIFNAQDSSTRMFINSTAKKTFSDSTWVPNWSRTFQVNYAYLQNSSLATGYMMYGYDAVTGIVLEYHNTFYGALDSVTIIYLHN